MPDNDLTIVYPPLKNKFRENIPVGNNPEYFLSIGQQGQHSFLMIGVCVNEDPKKVRTLARVAKTWDIDPGVLTNERFADLKALKKEGIISRLGNEMFTDPTKEEEVEVYSEAHQLSFTQLTELLEFLKQIEKTQLQDPQVAKGVAQIQKTESEDFYQLIESRKEKSDEDNNLLEQRKPIYQGITCFVPTKTDEKGSPIFTYQKLCDYSGPTLGQALESKAKEMATQVSRLDYSNTCRTSALDILNIALDFKTQVSKYFFKTLAYKTTLKGGQPTRESLWVLPPPPEVCKHYKNLSKVQAHALQKIYSKLERLPMNSINDKSIRDKFDALKSIYNKMAGSSEVKVSTLLEGIAKHKENLFKSRGLFGKVRDFLGIKSESHTILKNVLKDLREENKFPPTPENKKPLK